MRYLAAALWNDINKACTHTHTEKVPSLRCLPSKWRPLSATNFLDNMKHQGLCGTLLHAILVCWPPTDEEKGHLAGVQPHLFRNKHADGRLLRKSRGEHVAEKWGAICHPWTERSVPYTKQSECVSGADWIATNNWQVIGNSYM